MNKFDRHPMAIIKGTFVATRDIFNTANCGIEEVSMCLLHQHHLEEQPQCQVGRVIVIDTWVCPNVIWPTLGNKQSVGKRWLKELEVVGLSE